MYQHLLHNFTSNLPYKTKPQPLTDSPRKNRRPLRKPRDYDFSVSQVDWDQYKNDFILRTDAVWEKSKLYDIFYTVYKVRFGYLIIKA